MGDPDLTVASLRVARLRCGALWQRTRTDALELIDSAVRHWVPPGETHERLERALTARRRTPHARITPLLEAFAQQRPQACFVQIGASESPEREPLRAAIDAQRWRGVVLDPLPAALERLARRYPHLPRESFERAAIASEEGERPLYYVANGSGSTPAALRREALLFRRRFTAEREDEVSEVQTRCLTFASLCARHGLRSFDVLAIDTEGDDQAILEQVDLRRYKPALVVYESGHLTPQARSATALRLCGFGYQTVEHGPDTWCLRASALTPTEASVLEPIWRWIAGGHQPGRPLRATATLRAAARRALGGASGNPDGELFGLSDSERRYLASGYDDRVPLPAGAADYLTSHNPRLLELRTAYDALQLPASQHHVWDPEAVAAEVDLRYFRGDNLYLWHRPEHPRAMALSMFVYMRYLQSHGGEQLLGRLSEDGTFGCWTAEISGFGKVSRDLLDSANEILFLDRQLGVLGASGLRVLDIGAGWGRLAHRMTVAIPSLGDYCCVDAVPESSFLCEYYLSYRGCSPPARVLPLGDVQAALEPGSFDLAVNVHSFSECTLTAIQWWMGQLERLRVQNLFVVPNEPEGIISREPDGSYHDAIPVIEAAGYRRVACERVISDPAVRDQLRINDNFYLFTLST